jgi:hypothetical protein
MTGDPSFFWRELPPVRIASRRADGEIVSGGQLPLKYFGGTVPSVDDVIGTIWDDKDYDLSRVKERYLVGEFKGEHHWLLIVEPEASCDHLDKIAAFSLLTTDLEDAVKVGRPEKEIIARIQQLDGTTPAGATRIKPMARFPDED